MKNKYFLLLIMLGMLLMINANAGAQTSISLSQHLSYFSNSFYNYRQLPDINDKVGLSISHVFEGKKVQSQVYYIGDLNLFKNFSDRLYHNQAIGYDGYSVSTDEQRIFYFGVNLFWHDGQNDYNIYDFWKFQGYLNWKIYMKQNLIGRFGYILNQQSYSELPEFSYWEHYFYARINTYFQTGTSITFSINYGLKDYIPLQTTQGRGRRMMIDYFEMPGVDQLVTSIKLAQSIGMKTSLSLQLLNRLNPGLVSGSAAVINSEDLFTEDELFDDRYGYTGNEISLKVTHFFPAYIKAEIGANQYWKNYRNRQVYDMDGNVALTGDYRKDERFLIWAQLSRSFSVNWGVKTIRLSLNGGYLKNASNDQYYQFDNYYGTLGLEFQIKND